jgi:hypothetical protein
MINRIVIYLCLVPLFLNAQDITVKVVDDLGSPIEGAAVRIIYERLAHLKNSQTLEGETDETGIFQSSGSAVLGLWFWSKKEGYYDYGYNPAERDYLGMNEYPDKLEKTIQMRRIINPIPLYAKRTQTVPGSGENYIAMPEIGEWCGYDLEIGDWVSPNGEGETSDLLLRFSSEFVGFEKRFRQKSVEAERAFSKKAFAARSEEWTEEKFRHRAGDWNLSLEIAFPEPKEGMIRVVEAFNPQSVLQMPHQAPEMSYEPTHRYEIKTYGESAWNSDNDIGFFLRTRVVLDEDGEIESANYAKIHEDFKVTVDGKVSFKYYFNPVVNDRNLEFDSTRNLFKKGFPGTFNFVLP